MVSKEEEIQHVGVSADRLSRDKNALEKVFAKKWRQMNDVCAACPDPTSLLEHLLGKITPRDAVVAATITQWLGSEVGQVFLLDAMTSALRNKHAQGTARYFAQRIQEAVKTNQKP